MSRENGMMMRKLSDKVVVASELLATAVSGIHHVNVVETVDILVLGVVMPDLPESNTSGNPVEQSKH
jgi:hypothetical protein